MHGGYVYIMTNYERTTLYVGVTSNLFNRVYEHKNGIGADFTKRYRLTDMVYFEFHEYIEDAIKKEKQLKKWKRVWKNELIESINPEWKDLFVQIEEMQ